MSQNKKIKVLTLSDHPLSPSGVAHQTKLMIESLLKTGKFRFISFAGAIKHQNYNPQKTKDYEDDWIIIPVDGYGTQDQLRSIIRTEKPDIIWFMTDPRFWPWLWSMEQEIRPNIPLVYYHVWDNYPYPKFNKQFYDSNDVVVTISKVSDDIVRTVSPDVECIHLPHTVNTDIFKKYPESEVEKFKKESFVKSNKDPEGKMIFFWNNRNARRKQSGTLIYWFKDFLDEVGHDKACLVMHTDPKDHHGQDLEVIINELGLDDGQVLLSRQKMPQHMLALIYNMADCTINISDAEGFGLATLESLACETPIIVNMTGGLQEQVTNGQDFFGFGIEPASKAIIGSQDVPYIYEDRLNREDFLKAIKDFYNLKKEERNNLGLAGRHHVLQNYGYEKYCEEWVRIMTHVHEKYGSWENRKNYKSWTLKEIK